MALIKTGHNNKVAYRPLFVRFNAHSERVEDCFLLSRDDYLLSINAALSNLLNTRCHISEDDYNSLRPEDLTYGIPVLYGLPDFSYYDPMNHLSWQKLQRYIKNAIHLFEPRFDVSHIEVDHFNINTQVLTCKLEGWVNYAEKRELISYSVGMDTPNRSS